MNCFQGICLETSTKLVYCSHGGKNLQVKQNWVKSIATYSRSRGSRFNIHTVKVHRVQLATKEKFSVANKNRSIKISCFYLSNRTLHSLANFAGQFVKINIHGENTFYSSPAICILVETKMWKFYSLSLFLNIILSCGNVGRLLAIFSRTEDREGAISDLQYRQWHTPNA